MAQRRPALPLARRALTRTHLAFYRAVIEGVDLQRAWAQYLHFEGEFSDHTATATVTWVRQALIAEAMASGQPGLIGLFRRDPRQVKGSRDITLDEFASRFVDAGEFSEAELLALWEEEFGRRSRASPEERRARLSRRLREALQLLERSAQRTPLPEDSVAQWLSPALARRLTAAGLPRLVDLQRALASRRRQRWEAVRGIGPVWADRLTQWLEVSGLAPAQAAAQESPGTLEPLEGEEARWVRRWLDGRGSSADTRRNYRKAAERLLLWCKHERGVALGALTPADGIHYRHWLQTIGSLSPEEWSRRGWRVPQADWICLKSTPRDQPGWRPFALGGRRLQQCSALEWSTGTPWLSAASVAQELRVLRGLFRHLADEGCVRCNPWPMPESSARSPAPPRRTERAFSQVEWQHVAIDPMTADGERPRRLAAALWLSFGCGLRPAELLSLTIGSLRPDAQGWQLQVRGRGGRQRLVPLPSPARLALLRYLEGLGLDPARLSTLAPETPLLRGGRGRRRRDGSRPPTSALGYQTLHAELKRHFEACAASLEGMGQPESACRLRQATAHWLRHSCATIGLSTGALDLAAVSALLGHASASSALPYGLGTVDSGLADRLEKLTGR